MPIEQATTQQILEWATNPLTKAAVVAVGGFLALVGSLIVAWVKIVHPHVEGGIIAKARKDMPKYSEDLALLKQSNTQIHSEIAEIKSSVEGVRDKQEEHGKLIVGLTTSFDELRKSMNGSRRPKRDDDDTEQHIRVAK